MDLDDLSKSCRLCMKTGKNLRSIFNYNHKKWSVSDISKIIYDYTDVEVTVNDCSTSVCNLCLKQLTNISNFRDRCARANEQFKRLCKQRSTCETILDRSVESIPLVDLIKESKDGTFDEISDFEMPSPEPSEWDEQVTKPTSEDRTAINESEEMEGKLSKDLPKTRCKMKNSSKRKSADDWPKLKKRDLVGTKAYRGLCHLCGKEFQHLWVHLQSHSDYPTETCDICGKGFRSKAYLSMHILLHKEAEMPCEMCGKKYRTKMRLKRHMRVHTKHRPFGCTVCQKQFYTKYNLEVHSRIHSGERPFACSSSNCSERFAHSYALKHHMEKVHKGDRP